MSGDEAPRNVDVMVMIDADTIAVPVVGRAAAEELADAVVAAAERRETLRLPLGAGTVVINFARVTRTTVDIDEGAAGAVGIKR